MKIIFEFVVCFVIGVVAALITISYVFPHPASATHTCPTSDSVPDNSPVKS